MSSCHETQFTIPFAPLAEVQPSVAGWNIWAVTPLDLQILRGLPRCWLRRYRNADCDAEALLKECRWAEEWHG
jgi:hypothetical protein